MSAAYCFYLYVNECCCRTLQINIKYLPIDFALISVECFRKKEAKRFDLFCWFIWYIFLPIVVRFADFAGMFASDRISHH